VANKHIDQFRSLLKKRQGEQIFKLRNATVVKSEVMMNSKSSRYTCQTTQWLNFVPSLKTYLIQPGDLISSEQFNYT
jgi:hypothetical protein